MNAERKVRLTNQQYIQQRIFNINPRYANCLSWVYAATGFLELKQMTNNINISMQRGVKSTREDGRTEYKLESAFTVLENIKNTHKYWSKAKMRLLAMLENLGPFHFFFSLSAADYRYFFNISLIFKSIKCFLGILRTLLVFFKMRTSSTSTGQARKKFLSMG